MHIFHVVQWFTCIIAMWKALTAGLEKLDQKIEKKKKKKKLIIREISFCQLTAP